MSRATFDAYLRKPGCEIVSAEVEAGGATSFRHMVGVARRPTVPPKAANVATDHAGEAVYRRLRRVERRMPLHRLGLILRASGRRLRRLVAACPAGSSQTAPLPHRPAFRDKRFTDLLQEPE